MFSKTVVALCIHLALFNAVYSQALNRIIPISELQNLLSLGSNLIPNNVVPIGPNIVPIGPNVVPINQCGQNIVPLGPSIVPIGPNVVSAPNVVETVLSAPVTVPGTTTIIQDSSVANNLANALQLLVVSNLLSNTLPAPVEVLSPVSLNGLGGYSIVY